jgi:predicted Rossmann fold nucleotide-binding protein DprA/Smf involved in DNA uptake
MISCARNGGTALGVVADSLLRLSTRRELRELIISGNMSLITSYDPEAGFSVGRAMGRNRWIYALADRALVVACSEGKGGTWAGAVEALKRQRVYVKINNPARPGNDALRHYGAIPAPEDLAEIFGDANAVVAEAATGRSSSTDIFTLVVPHLLASLTHPSSAKELAMRFNVVPAQMNLWLKRLQSEGRVAQHKGNYVATADRTAQPSLFLKSSGS